MRASTYDILSSFTYFCFLSDIFSGKCYKGRTGKEQRTCDECSEIRTVDIPVVTGSWRFSFKDLEK